MAEQWHILIVLNEGQIREIMHQIFVTMGYNCLLANDGRAGLKAFRESRPSLIVTDLNLPLMSGIELLQQVRQEDPDAAVIVGSDSPHRETHRETATECLKLGADAYIILNPLDVGELLTAVERALARRGIRGKDPVSVSRVRTENSESRDKESLAVHTESLVGYFEHHSLTEPLFLPEHRVASQILPLVKAHTPSAADLHTIEVLCDSLDGVRHYDGAGWHDFRGSIHYWIELQRKGLYLKFLSGLPAPAGYCVDCLGRMWGAPAETIRRYLKEGEIVSDEAECGDCGQRGETIRARSSSSGGD